MNAMHRPWIYLMVATMVTISTFDSVVVSGHSKRSKGCSIPQKWNGFWYQKGMNPSLLFDKNNFIDKGRCVDSRFTRDETSVSFFVEDSRERCSRCVIIHEKHKNVLQYRETYCDDVDNLEEACSLISADAHLYSLFRLDAEPVKCPFHGSFTFSYNRGNGECRHPISTADSCSAHEKMLLRFQACAEVRGTEATIEELTCLATWKDGSFQYMVGKMVPRKYNAMLTYNDAESYRCFVYDHDPGNTSVLRLSQSADATCDGVISSIEGSRTLRLAKASRPTSQCVFPDYLTSRYPYVWPQMEAGKRYVFNAKNKSLLKIVAAPSTVSVEAPVFGQQAESPQHGTETEARVTCIYEKASEDLFNYTQIVGRWSQGCDSGYICLRFYKRSDSIVEVQRGSMSRTVEQACAQPYFDDSTQTFTTLYFGSSEPRKCPHITKTSGFRVMGSSPFMGEKCQDSKALTTGCTGKSTVEFFSACGPKKAPPSESRYYQCLGHWHDEDDDGTTYLVAELGSDLRKKIFCFIYQMDSTGSRYTEVIIFPEACPRRAPLKLDLWQRLKLQLRSAEEAAVSNNFASNNAFYHHHQLQPQQQQMHYRRRPGSPSSSAGDLAHFNIQHLQGASKSHHAGSHRHGFGENPSLESLPTSGLHLQELDIHVLNLSTTAHGCDYELNTFASRAAMASPGVTLHHQRSSLMSWCATIAGGYLVLALSLSTLSVIYAELSATSRV